MQVICITVPEEWRWVKSFFGFDHPVVGSEYTVEEVRDCSCGKHKQYQIAGFTYCLFADYYFATLPGLNADEMAELEKESIK